MRPLLGGGAGPPLCRLPPRLQPASGEPQPGAGPGATPLAPSPGVLQALLAPSRWGCWWCLHSRTRPQRSFGDVLVREQKEAKVFFFFFSSSSHSFLCEIDQQETH